MVLGIIALLLIILREGSYESSRPVSVA